MYTLKQRLTTLINEGNKIKSLGDKQKNYVLQLNLKKIHENESESGCYVKLEIRRRKCHFPLSL